MTLQALADTRRAGMKPDGIVKVVIGRRSTADDRPDVICVTAADRPAFMDWRAVIGLPVVLFTLDGFNDLGEQTLDAVRAAGGLVIAGAWRDSIVTTDEAIKPMLHRMWEVLCL